MQTVFILLTIQALMGAFDNLWHHEITEKLPSKPSARGELILHTAREFLYALVFILIGWYAMEGLWAWVFAGILVIEIAITLADFVIEDQTRRLPKFERILHTVLAINFGAILAFLVPVLLAWSARPTALTPVDNGIFAWVMTLFAIGVFFWALRDLVAVLRLTWARVPDWKRHPLRAGQKAAPRRLLVAGGTGFIGRLLVRRLVGDGDHLILLARNPDKARHLFGPHVELVASLDALPDDLQLDGVINLAGAPVIGLPWTKTRKRQLLQSRLQTTGDLLRLIRRLKHPPKVMLCASAIGFYGNRGDEPLGEGAGPQDIFMSDICRQCEQLAAHAAEHGVRPVMLRLGLVLGRQGGALPQLARPAWFGLGSILGSGRQWMSWIHVTDVVDAIRHLLDAPDAEGPYNLTAPGPVQQREFTKALGRVLHRPVWLRVPKFLIRGLLGEMADIFVEGQRVLPDRLEEAGFRFRFARMDDALQDLMGRPDAPGGATIYYNASCPVCSAEVGHYENRARRAHLPLEVADVSDYPQALKDFGLGPEDIRRRLYVLDGCGRLHGGVDAFLAIWRRLPAYHRLARLLALPGIYQLAALVYDGVIAPRLYAGDRRRRQLAPAE